MSDYISKAGSQRLADSLQTYWALRMDGETAPRFVRAAALSHEGQRFDVRSDMVDGTPRGWAWRWDVMQRKWRLVRITQPALVAA